MGASAKGPLDERVKTDIRISERVLRVVSEQSQTLGIPKNALFAMAVCLLSVRLVPMLRGAKKRSTMLTKIEGLFQETLKEARRAA